MKAILVIVPILGLLSAGLFISLKSSGASLRAPWRMKDLVRTVSSICMELLAYLLVLFGLQSIAGFPLHLLLGE